jgi:hypothetical protein
MLAAQPNEPHGTILGTLSQLARLTCLQPNLDRATDEEKHNFEHRLADMERRTAAYMEKALAAGSLIRNDLIREASCVAGSIYTKLQFRGSQIGDSDMQDLRERLLYIFTHLEAEIEEPQRVEAEGPFLMWILFCGGVLCVMDEQRPFFVSKIKSLANQLGIEGSHEVDEILRGYLWSDRIDNSTFSMLWQEVEMSR